MIDALAQHDLVELRERVRSNIEEIGLSFGPGKPMVVDPVPRVIAAAEWDALEAGLLQRARALNAFLLDAYGDQRIFEEGVVPRRLLETSSGYEPRMRGLIDPAGPPATVAGMDLIRDAEGELRVLEDNLRMPSGATYAIAVREAVGPELGPRPPPAAARAGRLRRGARRRRSAPPPRPGAPSRSRRSSPTGPRAAPTTSTSGSAANSAMPVVGAAELSTGARPPPRAVGRERHPGRRPLPPPRRGPALRQGRRTRRRSASCCCRRSSRAGCGCVNAIGTGLADDKLAHAYVEEMVRFYLGEEAQLRSVPSYDLSDRGRAARCWAASKSWW